MERISAPPRSPWPASQCRRPLVYEKPVSSGASAAITMLPSVQQLVLVARQLQKVSMSWTVRDRSPYFPHEARLVASDSLSQRDTLRRRNITYACQLLAIPPSPESCTPVWRCPR